MTPQEQTFFIKFVFGFLAIVGFFILAAALFYVPNIKSDLLTFVLGQFSIAFILVFRHVFKSGFKVE